MVQDFVHPHGLRATDMVFRKEPKGFALPNLKDEEGAKLLPVSRATPKRISDKKAPSCETHLAHDSAKTIPKT